MAASSILPYLAPIAVNSGHAQRPKGTLRLDTNPFLPAARHTLLARLDDSRTWSTLNADQLLPPNDVPAQPNVHPTQVSGLCGRDSEQQQASPNWLITRRGWG
eukprot:scaffold7262_cov538-Prasinococcus_capsulatus_cf.AAC.4